MRNKFIDPAGNRATYEWAINHNEEADLGKTRSQEINPNTADTGFVVQQNDSSPLTLQLQGTILEKAQLDEMVEWYKLCDSQTIHFEDFAGERYEVLITSFKPTRTRTIRNPQDFANAPYWFWRYELEMVALSIISGVWEGAA